MTLTPRQRRLLRYAQRVPDATGRPIAVRAPRHGDAGVYNNWGCRCVPCTRALTQRRHARRPTRGDGDEGRMTMIEDLSSLDASRGSYAHGTEAGYGRGCRCDRCRNYHNTFRRERIARLRAYLVEVDDRLVTTLDVPHGDYVTYRTYSCRCEPCTEAHTAHGRAYRSRRTRNALRRLRLRYADPGDEADSAGAVDPRVAATESS